MTPTGVPVTSVTLAVDRDFGKDGNKETDWVDIVAWNKTAKFLADNFSKGRMAVVVGRLQIRSYTDKDGNKRKAAEVVAENIYFGDFKKEEKTDGFVGGEPQYKQNDFAVLDGDDSQLPF
jgi:single-strand DNA-binding protein